MAASDWTTIFENFDRTADVAAYPLKLREVYNQMKLLQAIVARINSDGAFDEAVMNGLYVAPSFDGSAFASQMVYSINQLVTAWEANQNYRDLLGIL